MHELVFRLLEISYFFGRQTLAKAGPVFVAQVEIECGACEFSGQIFGVVLLELIHRALDGISLEDDRTRSTF